MGGGEGVGGGGAGGRCGQCFACFRLLPVLPADYVHTSTQLHIQSQNCGVVVVSAVVSAMEWVC